MAESLFLGHAVDGNDKFIIDRDDLTTHAVVVGRTGSGKTGLIHVLVEEAVMAGASVIVLDPKGDLTNLSLAFPNLTPQEFAPWVPAGKDPVEESIKWKTGILASGQDLERIKLWKDAANLDIYTPGYTKTGRSINMFPGLEPPIGDDILIREIASNIITSTIGALGIDADPIIDPRCVYLTELLLWSWKRSKTLPMDKWPALIVNPPKGLEVFDGIKIEEFFPRRDRLKLASAIVGFRRQAARWLEGPAFKIEDFTMPGEDGRPRVTIFTLRHLNADDRQLFVSMFLSNMVSWMYKAPSSGRLRTLIVLDEASGYLPPQPFNPPTKKPICTLLSQGRAQGLGLVIGSQNPNDLDYKALSNVGTWFLGGLRDRDTKRDLDAILKERDIDNTELLTLPEKSFMALTKDGRGVAINVRWALSYLSGPMDVENLNKLNRKESLNFDTGSALDEHKALSGAVKIAFVLTSDESKVFEVEVMYSEDNGINWNKATETENLDNVQYIGGPNGVTNSFIWDSLQDIGYRTAKNIIVSVVVKGEGHILVPPFDVCNDPYTEENSFNYD